jgi:hypothetical protein
MPKFPRWFGRGNTRAALLSSGLLALLITTSLASAAGEGQPLDGGARNPSANESQTYTRETEIVANTSTYGTRQSNKSTNGGAAIYGCRAVTGQEACLRGSNLNNGLSFSFESRGPVGGRITAAGGDGAKPFTTNATGVADGLNADRVDGQNADQIVAAARNPAGLTAANAQQLDGRGADAYRTRWVLIDAAGRIERQSGGFSVTAAYPTLPATAADPAGLRANGNVYINANEDLTDNGITVSIALQNAADQNGDGVTNGRADAEDANPEFSGEVSATQCGLAGIVTCAPGGTNNANHFVVSPRLSDGRVTTDATRKRFYVIITE